MTLKLALRGELVIDESFVSQGNSHHSMEPRTTMAYWENGSALCILVAKVLRRRCRAWRDNAA
ncbi:MAG: hypothetical protein CM1200mP36_01190 [Gammaproteobacteria bacterium]|nr:MAG: hypothetical protein CM1200mP36_01190 [Gammaproteobacteria bacterium]